MLEARRYRFFNVWRARCRWLETHFYAPMLHDGDLHLEEHWQQTLAEDYWMPRYHVSMFVAVGRRIRSTYLWILLIQTLAYIGKLVVHPFPAENLTQVMRRGDVGPVSGQVMLAMGGLYILTWSSIALIVFMRDRSRARARSRETGSSMG